MAVLKEDCQGFGDIVSQPTTNEDVFGNPINSVPLSTVMPEGELRQSDKCSLGNFLMKKPNAIKHIHPKDSTWLVDSLAAVRASKLCKTSIEWINVLIKHVTHPSCFKKGVWYDH